jgi:hypothetical protein
MNETSNELVWQAADQLKAGRLLLAEARTNLVLAGLGEHSIRFQKRLALLDRQLINMRKAALKTVGVRMNTKP